MGSLRIDEVKGYTPVGSHGLVTASRRRTGSGPIFLTLALAVGGLLFLYPFLWMLATSLKPEIEVYSAPLSLLPGEWKWSNYREAFELVPFGRFYLNTVIMTICRVIGQMALASMAAYAFARLRFPGRSALFVLVLAVMMVPSIVTMIPRFILLMTLGWLDTFYGLIIPGLADAFGIFLLRQFFLTLPQELLDAAAMDGCNPFQSFWRIALPLARPALAAYGFLVILWTWNDFLWPLVVVTSTDMMTISLGIQLFQNQYSKNITLMMAAASISILPMMVLFLLAQRYIIQGITMSGLKL
ncbi:MAG TPA: carbohydrate ABC transporter permease [Caldilineaceae bacterium]|nr:carbohydrate ABC transporter permease [Caldilineaceae bacterium]